MKIFISKNGHRLGEFELHEVNHMLQGGQIDPGDLAWQEGLPDWVPVRTIPGVTAGPPPVPPQPQVVITSLGANPFAWFIHSFRNYANFKGRARRREWWSFWFIQSIPYILLSIIGTAFASSSNDLTGGQILIFVIGFFYWAATAIPFLSLTTRRLHDIGLSAWWLLLVFTPCIGGIFLTVCALIAGQKFPNKYGDQVRGK